MFVNIPRTFLINVSRILPAHFASILVLNLPGRCHKTIFGTFSLHLPPSFLRNNPRTFQCNIPDGRTFYSFPGPSRNFPVKYSDPSVGNFLESCGNILCYLGVFTAVRIDPQLSLTIPVRREEFRKIQNLNSH